MREIKFRAWDTITEKIFNVFSICWLKDANETIVELDKEDNSKRTLKTIKLMQFTGLKDKNGKEIYEGDIVVYQKNLSTLEQNEVIWDKYRWTVKDFYNSSFDEPSDAFSEGVFEVIGNIYENPELLNEKI